MKIFLAALVLFLLAFSGLAAGLLLKRKGLRGGCKPASGAEHDCHCEGERGKQAKHACCEETQEDVSRENHEKPVA